MTDREIVVLVTLIAIIVMQVGLWIWGIWNG